MTKVKEKVTDDDDNNYRGKDFFRVESSGQAAKLGMNNVCTWLKNFRTIACLKKRKSRFFLLDEGNVPKVQSYSDQASCTLMRKACYHARYKPKDTSQVPDLVVEKGRHRRRGGYMRGIRGAKPAETLSTMEIIGR